MNRHERTGQIARDRAAARRPLAGNVQAVRAAQFPGAHGRQAQPRRLCGGACGGRSAGASADPWLDAPIDWDRTIAFREHLWDLGFGVAEAMDTAQRGMGLSWPDSLELIRRSVAAAKSRNGVVFSGAGTDHLAPDAAKSIDDVIRAYEEQIAAIEKFGGRIILMASRALARVAQIRRRLRQGLRSHPRARCASR